MLATQSIAMNEELEAFLLAAMERELELHRQFNQHLQAEKQHLEQRRSAELKVSLKQKAALISAIEQAAQTRLSAVQLRISDKGHHDAFINMVSNHQKLYQKWQSLAELIATNHYANEVNGVIVARSQTSITRTINLLHQAMQPNHLTTYTANGHAQNTPLVASGAKA